LSFAGHFMRESNVILKSLKRSFAAILPLCLLCCSLAAYASEKKTNDGDEAVGYAAARKDILQFEGALNNVINTFSKGPFGVVYKAKGSYLQGFGFNFTFLIDIQRAIITTPFGDIKRHEATQEQKKQRIEELKEMLIRMLQDNGKKIKQLRKKEDCISIVAFIDDKDFGAPSANKTIVLRVLKRDLDELGNRSDRLDEFRKRIKIVEY
jgi:hypothetical protein